MLVHFAHTAWTFFDEAAQGMFLIAVDIASTVKYQCFYLPKFMRYLTAEVRNTKKYCHGGKETGRM